MESEKVLRMFLKGKASFKCSNTDCAKTWVAAYCWNREERGTYCDHCDEKARLIHVIDEFVNVYWYRCTNKRCRYVWNDLHEQGRQANIGSRYCTSCGTDVKPNMPPEKMWARHYWWKCVNPGCNRNPDWEDYSLDRQRRQRCHKCCSRGDMRMLRVTHRGVGYDENCQWEPAHLHEFVTLEVCELPKPAQEGENRAGAKQQTPQFRKIVAKVNVLRNCPRKENVTKGEPVVENENTQEEEPLVENENIEEEETDVEEEDIEEDIEEEERDIVEVEPKKSPPYLMIYYYVLVWMVSIYFVANHTYI